MDNIAILDNPFSEGITVSSRGVGIDSKAAKLNNNTKRPVLVKHWEDAKMKLMSKALEVKDTVKDSARVLKKLDITLVNYAKETISSGAKKLRVNQIVNGKTTNIYNNGEKVDVTPLPEEKPVVNITQSIPTATFSAPIEPAKPMVEERKPVSMEPTVLGSRADIHGRHEHTGEIPVDAIREAVRNNNPVYGNSATRSERNIEPPREEIKETNGVDMDLYTSLMQNTQEDVSRQLQGAKKELSLEKAESRKLAEQYGAAVKELEKLKEEIESKKKMKEQHEKQELSTTLNDLEAIKRENLERTSDLSAIRAEISRLEAQKRELEDNNDVYNDYRSFGRSA